jgi:hypothetical protein
MNYGEEITYWFLRLNGFFPISNFVIHRSSRIRYSSDCDVLAVRMPHVYEEIGGQPDDWDPELAAILEFNTRFIGVICEVKTGGYEVEEIFRPEYVDYAVERIGLVPRDQIDTVKSGLMNEGYFDANNARLCKLLVANHSPREGQFIFRTINSLEDFILNRVRKYPVEKYADRMHFNSKQLQYMIHEIHRERQERTNPRITL